jgi:hypothetical protein
VRTAGVEGAAGGPSPQQQQQQDGGGALSLRAAERANQQPGVKEQRLMAALWNLDRIDQRTLPLDSSFVYGTPQAPGTGG